MSSPGSPGKTSIPASGGKEISSAAFQAAFEIAKILKDLSKKDQLAAMQMAGVQGGMSVTSTYAVIAAKQGSTAAAAPKGPTGKRPPPSTIKWGKEVKDKQSQIADLNREISAEAGKAGRQLPENHPLLKKRGDAFRELKALKSKGSASQ
jgi:hypothetical protein